MFKIKCKPLKQTANKICFSEDDIYDKPLDRIFTADNSEFKEISDYNLSNTIIRSTFINSGVSQDSADAIVKIFEKGIRFWKDPADKCTYTQALALDNVGYTVTP